MKALGRDGINLKKISEVLRKKVRIIPAPRGIHDVKSFIENIVKPVTFKDVEVKGDEIILTAGGTQNKASLIGRDKRRLIEMQRVIKDYFDKEFRIV